MTLGPTRAAAGLALVAAAALGATAQTAQPAEAVGAPATPKQLLERFVAAWAARDVEAYTRLWSAERHAAERAFASDQFGADESRLRLFRPAVDDDRSEPFEVRAEVFEVREPHGQVGQWLLSAEPAADGWRFSERAALGRIDGLVHLSLNTTGYRAAGLRLFFEDFELEMERGTLFTSPAAVGLTALVFVGRGEVRFRPRPPTEQEQLERFCGRRELVVDVDKVFVRLHPDELAAALSPLPLQRDPRADRVLNKALDWYHEHANRFFVLDAAAPRSPWWLLPGRGDGIVTFDAGRRGVLTYSSSRSEPEGINLFDREERRQICLYPRAGSDTRYDEDDSRAADVLHHDIAVRVDPGRQRLWGTSTLRMRLLNAGPTLRLRLDDALEVQSVTSPGGGSLMFFRVRDRNTVMVSLGSYAGTLGALALTVRYTGVLRPGPIKNEVLQLFPEPSSIDVPLDTALVYTNQNAWYPTVAKDDHATSRLRVTVPESFDAVSGGRRTAHPDEAGNRVVEFEQDRPGRYVTLAVGRLKEVGSVIAGEVTIEAHAVSRQVGNTEDDLEVARDIVDFFTREFGPCPFPRLTLLEVEGDVPGGHSPPGMVVLARRPTLLVRRGLRDDPARVPGEDHLFLAHELAHQWWGHGVAGQNYRERWISEAFAHYAAALWLRDAHGEERFGRVLRHYERWARRGSEYGPIHLGHRVGHIDGEPQAFRAVVYDKGAYVLHMLRGVVGDAAFRGALASLQAEFRYRKIGNDDVREALERASSRDLRPYFQAWVHGTAIMELRYQWRRQSIAGGHGIQVSVHPRHVPGPVPLELLVKLDGGGEHRERVILPPEGGVFDIAVPRRARDVEINQDLGLLAEVEKI